VVAEAERREAPWRGLTEEVLYDLQPAVNGGP